MYGTWARSSTRRTRPAFRCWLMASFKSASFSTVSRSRGCMHHDVGEDVLDQVHRRTPSLMSTRIRPAGERRNPGILREPAVAERPTAALAATPTCAICCRSYPATTRSRNLHSDPGASPARSRPIAWNTGGDEVTCWMPACMSRNSRCKRARAERHGAGRCVREHRHLVRRPGRMRHRQADQRVLARGQPIAALEGGPNVAPRLIDQRARRAIGSLRLSRTAAGRLRSSRASRSVPSCPSRSSRARRARGGRCRTPTPSGT